MTTAPIDDVTKIHRRYSLTLINPSSFYHSLIISIVVTTLLVVLTNIYYFNEKYDIGFGLIKVVIALLVTQYIDSRFTKNKEYSKSIHMSLFGNSLWLITIISGLIFANIFDKIISITYIIEGMFLFSSFRIGIFTTTLGLRIKKSWIVCFIQPIAMLLALLPNNLWGYIFEDITSIIYGIIFLVIATTWSILTDRAGRPYMKSTHELIQAYLSSISKNDPHEVESIIEKQSKTATVSTYQLRLYEKHNEFRLILPEIHPGPYNPIGGSNIPFLIYKNMKSSAMIMHSVSDHSLNLPSKSEVNKYLESLNENIISAAGKKCTEPVITQINRARTTGFIFDGTAILFLSLSPYGSEDFPSSIKNKLEIFAKNYNLEHILIIDCHNAMGKHISNEDENDLLESAKKNLLALTNKEKYNFEFGYANSDNMNLQTTDLGCSGIGILCLSINSKKYFIGWADSNNMENGVREKIVNKFMENGYNLLEICTSDTHYTTRSVRNKNGYYQFGATTSYANIERWYLQIAKRALMKTTNTDSCFEILQNKTKVKVMGSTIYKKYSQAVDNSIIITKIFLILSVGFFFFTMIY